MSLTLTAQEHDEICLEAAQRCLPIVSIDRLETIYPMPAQLGQGYSRVMELYPGLELSIFNETYRDDVTFRASENQHPVQFQVRLTGIEDVPTHVLINAEQSYIGGSGIQRALTVFSPASKPQVGVDIHLQPQVFSQFFATPTGALPADLQPLVQENDWQRVFSPKTTGAMRSVVQQMIDCPLMGTAKRMYLQGKVFELMALQLQGLTAESTPAPDALLKPSQIVGIHHAAEILRSHLEQPPSQEELAQRLGISCCTLRKGFRSVFGMTPLAYLMQQRMQQAEHLLREANWTVVEVANQVGYANPGHFAAAFKRQFGIRPSECARGRKPN
jgi:AraC-like DNA-binding protein